MANGLNAYSCHPLKTRFILVRWNIIAQKFRIECIMKNDIIQGISLNVVLLASLVFSIGERVVCSYFSTEKKKEKKKKKKKKKKHLIGTSLCSLNWFHPIDHTVKQWHYGNMETWVFMLQLNGCTIQIGWNWGTLVCLSTFKYYKMNFLTELIITYNCLQTAFK